MALRAFAILSVLCTVVLAQSSSNPLIPQGISSGCSNYLTQLDSSNFTSCTSPIISALSQYTPGGNASTSLSSINAALNSVCASSVKAQCPDNVVSAQLSSFYAACSAELTSTPNSDVKRMYDTIYVLPPLRTAICSKSDNGQYCAAQLGSQSGKVDAVTQGSNPSSLEQYLYTTQSGSSVTRRDSSSALIPNVTTYEDTNLVFLFLEPSTDSTTLCTSCTRSILTSFITFESNTPYAPGLNNSVIMGGQTALYNSVQSTCGTNFLSGAVQAAGGLSSGIMSGDAHRSLSHEVSVAVSAILGAAAFAVASI
ncbi:hypothetical protein EDD16DRAFT_1883292 [Pisolithus croceorrhizus]|nr:hypothetical protein EV401DRAFT_2269340 [Pisolithus croceorrhizus]KAI6126315.1 hypothetical protein EDD16DRAFT_1883292 [Pisolithus croceorrhizus]KAI6167628.1 hypothetical protein EDD17DRAFT_1718748 [Pisolithus thermaeus]